MTIRRVSRIRRGIIGKLLASNTFGNLGFEVVPDSDWSKDKTYLGGSGYRKGFENFSAIPNGAFAGAFDGSRKTNAMFATGIEMLNGLDGINKVFLIASTVAGDNRGVQTRFTNPTNQPVPIPSGNIIKLDTLVRISDASQQLIIAGLDWSFNYYMLGAIVGDTWYMTDDPPSLIPAVGLAAPQDNKWYHVHFLLNSITGDYTMTVNGVTSTTTGNWVGPEPVSDVSIIAVYNGATGVPTPGVYDVWCGGFDCNLIPGYYDNRILEDIPKRGGYVSGAFNFTDWYFASIRTNYLEQQATILLVNRPRVVAPIWIEQTGIDNPQELGSQLLANPTFDVDLSNWIVNDIPGFTRTGVIIRDTVDPYAGAGALQVQGVGSGGGASSEYVSITGGLSYLVEFYYKKVFGNPIGEFFVSFYDSGQFLIGSKAIQLMSEPSPATYEKRRFYLFPPNEANYLRIHAAVKGNNRDANFDEFKLIRIGLPYLQVQDGHGSGTIYRITPAYQNEGWYFPSIEYTKTTNNATIRLEAALEFGLVAFDNMVIE